MQNRMRLSEEVSQYLNILSKKLGLRRNIVCRLAIGRSLVNKKSVGDFKPKDTTGYEFNRITITGDKDLLFRALVVQHEKKRMSDGEYFSKYLRNHIERGTRVLYKVYSRVNSPVRFLVGLFDIEQKKQRQTKLF